MIVAITPNQQVATGAAIKPVIAAFSPNTIFAIAAEKPFVVIPGPGATHTNRQTTKGSLISIRPADNIVRATDTIHAVVSRAGPDLVVAVFPDHRVVTVVAEHDVAVVRADHDVVASQSDHHGRIVGPVPSGESLLSVVARRANPDLDGVFVRAVHRRSGAGGIEDSLFPGDCDRNLVVVPLAPIIKDLFHFDGVSFPPRETVAPRGPRKAGSLGAGGAWPASCEAKTRNRPAKTSFFMKRSPVFGRNTIEKNAARQCLCVAAYYFKNHFSRLFYFTTVTVMTSQLRTSLLFIAFLGLGILGALLALKNSDHSSPREATCACSAGHMCGDPIDTAASKDSHPQESAATSPPSTVPTEDPAAVSDETRVDDSGEAEPTASSSGVDDKPNTASKRPKLEEVKKLPIGAPREPAPPRYTSNLDDDRWQVHIVTPGLDDRQKLTRWVWGEKKQGAPRRLVCGRVFEVIGGERIPLSGVLVVGGWNRTFTDSEGRYEMLSTFWEPSEDDKQQGQQYRFELFAQSPGYVDLRGRHTYSNLDETSEGIDLFLVHRDSRIYRIRFENPQVAGGLVTIVLARNDSGDPDLPGFAIDWDEKHYIIATVDPQTETWFSVPLRYYYTGAENDYGLRSVSAPNILADVNTIVPESKDRPEIIYNVRLLVEDTVTIAGSAVDMRTGQPIPHARVYGPGTTEFTVADEQGRFELITAKTPRGPRGDPLPENESRYVYVSDERYATMTVKIKDSNLHADGTGRLLLGPGGNLNGPWTFQLRPWVEATIDCTFLAAESRPEATLELMFDVVDALPGDRRRGVDGDGLCRFPRIPWGAETIRLATRVPFRVKELNVEPTSWDGEEPYQLTVRE